MLNISEPCDTPQRASCGAARFGTTMKIILAFACGWMLRGMQLFHNGAFPFADDVMSNVRKRAAWGFVGTADKVEDAFKNVLRTSTGFPKMQTREISWLADFECNAGKTRNCDVVCGNAGLVCKRKALSRVKSSTAMSDAVVKLPGGEAKCLSSIDTHAAGGWDGPTITSNALECAFSSNPRFVAECSTAPDCGPDVAWGRLCACNGNSNKDLLGAARNKTSSQIEAILKKLYPTFPPKPDAGYRVTQMRANRGKPFIDARANPKESNWSMNYAPAFLVLPSGEHALVVRSVNGTEYESKGGTASTADDPDYVTITRFIGKDGSSNIDDVRVEPILSNNISLAPEGKREACGLQDPRIVRDWRDGTYYLTVAAYGNPRPQNPNDNPRGTYCGNADSLLASTKTPLDPASWKRLHYNCNGQCGKSAAILIRETGVHYMFWGIPDIHVSTSKDLINWEVKINSWASPLPEFDEMWIEAGSPPEKLDDGNYIMTYNTVDAKMWWGTSYLILDEDDPTKILQRGSHLVWPKYPHETGKTEEFAWIPYKNCVGAMNSLHRLPGKEQRFMGYYTAGDAVAGAAVITVEKD